MRGSPALSNRADRGPGCLFGGGSGPRRARLVIPSAAMRPLTVWVLASPRDRSLHVLESVPPGVTFVRGAERADFLGAPRPDALLACWMPRAALESIWDLVAHVPWIHSRSAGVEEVLVPELVEGDTVLTNARGVFSPALAEFTLGAILYFAKGFRRMIGSQAAGRWDPFDLEPVAGRTLGIVGYGDIGRAVAEKARAFGMRVLAVRRRPEASAGDPLVDEVVSLDRRVDLMRRADDVVVATPLTPETRGLVGRAEIAAMKPGATLINLGRGPVVDEPALIEALEARRIRGAALDVFTVEPLPAGHPFYRLENVLLSPHCADNKPGWLEESLRFFLTNLERFRRGEPLLNVVDKQRGY
jgi:phosphoglycerate dehydrogenase-like enzyme